MACQVLIQSWSFPRLVGAFLDLAVAYFLLCCSLVAFFLSKFLDLLGFTLPCPCNGFFGHPARGPCLQRALVECPTDTISSLHSSVLTNFPFHSILSRNHNSHLNLKLLTDNSSIDAVLHFQGEASQTSFSHPRTSPHTLSSTDSFPKFDAKAKSAAPLRTRCRIRRRRRPSADYVKLSSSTSYDHFSPDVRCSPTTSSQVHKPTPLKICGRSEQESESNDIAVESKQPQGTSFGNLKTNVGHEFGVDGEDVNLVRILELALEEEQAARAALCSELEQERLAAATAADEAMAMISRLQEEKASIEIEAHQYQRILEEKSVYDAEEMNILKEIIVRRERERLILEKEVEAYRKVFQENNGMEVQSYDRQGQHQVPFPDPSVDPMLILEQLSESIDKQGNSENMSNFPDYSCAHVQKQTSTASEGNESSILPPDHESKIIHELEASRCSTNIPDHLLSDNETNQDIQEKGILSTDEVSHPQLCDSSYSQGEDNRAYPQQNNVCGADVGKQMPPQVDEPLVHDVHEINLSKTAANVVAKGEWPFWTSGFQTIDVSADKKFELDVNRSSSDMVDRFPTASSSPDRSFVSELRRNSMSAVDHERLKIDNEIGWLRARLTAVQEQKEKLKSSMEHQERGKSELQLLEDITSQLREIRHRTAPVKAARQGSLPPLSSKVTSKKRRSRSVVRQSESS